jgi:peptidoglycan hydrolase-like protein with peptidoglycan-binding domain
VKRLGLISSAQQRLLPRARKPGATAPAGAAVNAQVIRRNRALGVGLAAVVGASAVSWTAASSIRSPAEIAARTAPPEASAISVAVERRLLSSDVTVRGTVRYGAPKVVSLPVSAAKKSSGIITTPAVKGDELVEGDVALTVSGRPVFVFQGAQPAYRDMGPGTTGEDVRQLEEALSRLGLAPGTPDGAYDTRTAAAVSAWYQKAGSSLLGPTEEQLQTLRSEQRAELSDSIAAQSEVLAAQEALAAAQRDLALAHQRGRAVGLPLPAGVPAGSAAEAAARSRADQERVAAQVRLGNAKRALDRALEAERQAQARLEEARNRQPPPSNEEYSALNRDVREASKKVTLAREDLTAAQEAAAAAGAPPDASGATSPEAAQAARDAAVAARDAKLEAATAQAEIDKAQNAVDFARRRVALLSGKTRLGSIAGKFGPGVPADEVLFFPSLPLRVDEVKLQPGDEALGPVMTVTNSRLVVESALSASDAKLVRPGAAVGIRSPDLGIDATGSVTYVDTTPGTHGVDPHRFYMEVTPAEIGGELLGSSVVQTISVQSTDGEVLAVPVSALSMAADGRTRVQVVGAQDKTRYVTVVPGLSAKGHVEITPVGGTLKPGDLVIVGRGGTEPRGKGAGRK